MSNSYNNNFIRIMKEMSLSGKMATDEDLEVIAENKELFALFASDKQLTNESKKFALNTAWSLINNFPTVEKSDILIHSVLSLNDGMETDSKLFAHFLNLYMHSDSKYNNYISFKHHNIKHLIIIKSCKRIHKCAFLVYKICKNEIDNDFIGEYIKTICCFNGDFDNHSMMDEVLEVMRMEINSLTLYDFNIYVGHQLSDIYGHVMEELIDCGDELEEYKDKVSFLLSYHKRGFSNSLSKINFDDHEDSDLWSHKFITEFHK